jgi:hypothetical protein
VFVTISQPPHPDEIAGGTAAKLRAIERQITELIEERTRLRRLLGGDPFRVEERFRRLAELAARAEVLAREHQQLGGSEEAQ